MLAPGTRLGPYEIIATAGAGGMGEVYRARDTRLERTVAIKVLASDMSGRPEVLQRFEREARAVSTLNHPNICTLHDVGNDHGTPYLVMEYVEGETLADRLARGPLPMADMWRIAIQMGDALDQAHRRGIVHRDLKPGNVMLAGAKGSTNVKLLDFGLAKLPETPGPLAAGSLTSLPTVAQSLTTEGTIVGTLQYMAPEQLEGKDADARSDIFAFGTVLYEMVTGRKAFEGQSQASLISAIMKDDLPPVATGQAISPPALDRVIRQCVAKDPDERWQTVRDLTRELRWISQGGSQGAAGAGVAAAMAAVPRGKMRFGAAALAAALGVALAALAAIHFREKPPEERQARFLVDAPGTLRWYDVPALSPDGTQLAFSASTPKGAAIFLRALDSTISKPLPGAEDGAFPFWSPDGKTIGFFAKRKLKKVNLADGSAVTIGEATQSCCGTWNQSGAILFSGDSATTLWQVSAAGGTPARLAQASPASPGATRTSPCFLPDGRHFFYTATSLRVEERGVWIGSLDSSPPVRLLPDVSNAQYSTQGYLLFNRSDVLLAQAFDAQRLRLSGEAFPVAEQVAQFGAIPGAHFSVRGGNLAYRTGQADIGTEMVWFDRSGNRLGTVGEAADYTNPALSPDGRLLAVGKGGGPGNRKRDLWVFDLARGTSSRLTFDPADDLNPTWSPDGQSIAFASDRKGARDLYRKLASGTGPEETLLQSAEDKAPEDWTRDGKFLIYNAGSMRTGIWALPLSGDRKPMPLLSGPFSFRESQVSPNGKWIAYVSNESGKDQVFVQDFPPAGGKWQISNAGGAGPQWSRDGKELFYTEGSQLMAVAIKETSGRLDAGVPKALFTTSFSSGGRNRYVVSPDGKKFLILTQPEVTHSLPLTMVLNWQVGIKK